MRDDTGLPEADESRTMRLAAGRVAAVVTLVGGVLAMVALQLSNPSGPVTATYQLGITAVALVPSALVLRLGPDSPRRLVDRLLLAQTVVLVGVECITALRFPGNQTPLAFLALGLVASAHLLPVRSATVVLTAALAVVGTGQVASGLPITGVAWTMAAVATIGAVTIVAVSTQRRALRRETEARDAAIDATAAVQAVLEATRTSSSVDPEAVLQAVVDATGTLGGQASALRLFDEDGRLSYAATMHVPASMTAEPRPPGEGLAGEVLRQGRTVVLEDYPAFSGAVPGHVEEGVRSVVGVPLELPDGTVLGVLTVARSSDEVWTPATVGAIELLAGHAASALQLSRELLADRKLLAALQGLQARQADFVATVSHELRTPLTVIRGMTSTLLARGEQVPPDVRRELLERIAANTTVLGSIIEELLDAARLDGGLTVAATELSLRDLAADAVGRLAALSSRHELVLDAGDPATVLADRQLLERVFENLLSNALRHTPPGTTVTVGVHRRQERAFVSVVDDGPGVPADLLPLLTQRFVRGGDVDTRATRGLGIGLALVEEVLQLHGSRLEIVSRPGEGASFSFSLPLASHPEAGALATTRPARTDADGPDADRGGDGVRVEADQHSRSSR